MALAGDSKAPEHPTDVPPHQASRGGALLDRLAQRQAVLVPILSVLLAFLVGALLIRLQGVNPWAAYSTLLRAALFSTDGLLTTLQKATPLVFGGLAVAVGLRVGLFNIGAQGQLLWGAIGAVVVGTSLPDLPGFVLIPLALLGGAAGGAAWAAIAGALKATRGVHEVISTIMLNSIAAGIIEYLVLGPMQEPNQTLPRSREVPAQAFIADVGFIPLGFVLAVFLAGLVAWMLRRTTTGFTFDTVGKNKWAARYAGMGVQRTVILAMCLSGALAGLGGAVETLGVVHRYESGSSAGLGFDGITIALLARANPIATIPAALLVGTLRSGASALQFQLGIQPEIVDVLLAITLLLVSIPLLGRLLFGRRARQGVALTSGWGS